MLPIATANDVGGIKVGNGLLASSDGTLSVTSGPLSVTDHFSVYFTDDIGDMSLNWLVTGTCSISEGHNPGVAILEKGPSTDIELDIYHLDNQTRYDPADPPPTVGTVTFQAGDTFVQGTISFSQQVSLEAGNVLCLRAPQSGSGASWLRLAILTSTTS